MWKVYFFIYGFFIVFGTLGTIVTHSATGILVIPDFIVTILSSVGMFSYSFHKKILTKKFWKFVWWSVVVLTVIEVSSKLFPHPYLRNFYFLHTKTQTPVFLSIILSLLSIPLFYMLYQLAFKDFQEQTSEAKKQVQKPYSELAITSFILGVTSIFLPLLLTLPSCITGILALQKIAKGKERGKGMAWFGIGVFFFQSTMLGIILVSAMIVGFHMQAEKTQTQNMSKKTALQKMSTNELEYLHRHIEKITADTTPDAAFVLLGEPSAILNLGAYGNQYLYACPEDSEDTTCVIRVYFYDSKAYKLTWENEDKFTITTYLTKTQQNI